MTTPNPMVGACTVADVNIVQFCDWIIGTPMLLVDLAMLAKLGVPEVGACSAGFPGSDVH